MSTHVPERYDLADYEGLVKTTARMFAAQVGREEHDLEQELRIRVWRACESYDPAKATTSLRSYVYSAVCNKCKDFKRDASREKKRRERYEVGFVHTEDMVFGHSDDEPLAKQDRLEELFHHVEHSAVYGGVDDRFTLPAGVTERECEVLLLLTLDMTMAEIVVRLGITRGEATGCLASLRLKFADWAPAASPSNSSPPVTKPQKNAPSPEVEAQRIAA